MPHEDPHIIREPADQILVLAGLVGLQQLALALDLVGRDFDFEFVFLFGFGRGLVWKG